MNGEVAKRLLGLPLCRYCQSLFLESRLESVLKLSNDDLAEENAEYIKTLDKTSTLSLEDITSKLKSNQAIAPCMSCLGCLDDKRLDVLAENIHQELQANHQGEQYVRIEVEIPPVLDVSRIGVRTIITESHDRNINFTTFDIIINKILSYKLYQKHAYTSSINASMIISVRLTITNQLLYCKSIRENFVMKKLKRKFYAPQSITHEDDPDNISRSNIDCLLLIMKPWKAPQIQECKESILNFFQQNPMYTEENMKFAFDAYYAPIYVYGRYNKHARDVPQSPWSLTPVPAAAGSAASSSSTTNPSDAPEAKKARLITQSTTLPLTSEEPEEIAEEERKGRGSVEEIFSSLVSSEIGCLTCHLHACGREDIDVRCLGNGRPFVLEILQAKKRITQAWLSRLQQQVNTRQGTNAQGDISIYHMQLTTVKLWENMQNEAEEKDKGYACVVWTKDPITPAMLTDYVENAYLLPPPSLPESFTRKKSTTVAADEVEVEEDDMTTPPTALPQWQQQRALSIYQKTPLRVMHRRSLMTRTRTIYAIETTYLNEHFFLMRLVTSAGAYVKEFVHGDLGRTKPSIASLLHTQAEILQLDVVWLYDEIETKYAEYLPLSSQKTQQEEKKKDEEEKLPETLVDIHTHLPVMTLDMLKEMKHAKLCTR